MTFVFFVTSWFTDVSMYADLTDFLTDLDRRRLLARIAEPVSPDLEIAAVTDRACKSPDGGPALLFERPTGFEIPVASNVFGSMERMCLALGVKTLDDLAREVDELLSPPMPKGLLDAVKMLPLVGRLTDLMPKTVKDAPCQEIVRRDATLDELPILKCWPGDGGRFVTLPLVFTKDPETGMRNIGTYRMQVFDGRTTGMHWQRHKGGAQHHRVAERLGKRLEVAVALSPEPVLTYCATAPMPEKGSTSCCSAGSCRTGGSRWSSASPWISRCPRAHTSSSKATSSRASGGARGRSAITPGSTRRPTTIRCST